MAAGWLQLGDLFTIITRPFKQGAYGENVAEIDAIRGTRNLYYGNTGSNWAAGHPAQGIFTISQASPTGTFVAANNALFPNAPRVRIISMILYAATAGTTFTFYDSTNQTTPTNITFTTQYATAQQNIYVSKTQMGEGGWIISNGLVITPSTNAAEVWLQVIPEYVIQQ